MQKNIIFFLLTYHDGEPWKKKPQQTWKMMHFVNLKLIQKGFIHSILTVCIQEYGEVFFLNTVGYVYYQCSMRGIMLHKV